MSRPLAWIRSFLGPHSGEKSRFYPLVAFIIVTLAVSGIILGEIDGVLRAIHGAGRPAYGMEVFPGPLTDVDFGHRAKVVDEAFGVWKEHADRLGKIGRRPTSGGVLVIGHALIDTFFFLPAYLLLLGLLIWRSLRHVGTGVPAGGRLYSAKDNPENDPAGSAARLVFKVTPVILLVTALADLGENIFEMVIGAAERGAVTWLVVLKLMWFLKWSGVAVLLISMVIGVAIYMRAELPSMLTTVSDSLASRLSALRVLRVPLVLAIAFGIAVLLPEQSWDVPRRWSLGTGIVVLLLAMLYSYFNWQIAYRIALWGRRVQTRYYRKWHALFVGVGTTVLGIAFFLVAKDDEVHNLPWGIAIPGVMVFAAAVTDFLLAGQDDGIPDEPELAEVPPEVSETAVALAPLVGVVPLVLVGLSMVRASAATFFYAPSLDLPRTPLLFGFGIVMAYGALGIAAFIRRYSPHFTVPQSPKPFIKSFYFWAFPGLAVVVTVTAILIEDGLWRITETVSATGVLIGFFITLTFAGAAWFWVAEAVRPPCLFRILNVKRIPVFLLILVWGLIATKLETGGFHDVRVSGGLSATSSKGKTVAEGFSEWLGQVGLPTVDASSAVSARSGPVEATPMIFVAGSGGGIRAGYWTAMVLDCIFERQEAACSGEPVEGAESSDHVFVMSGISGGSLGVTSYLAHRSLERGREDPSDWVAERLGHDFLSAQIAWMTFVEAPRSLLMFKPGMDRAEVLERAWEEPWRDAGEDLLAQTGLFEIQETEKTFLMLNGASVNEGCRFLASVFNQGSINASKDCRGMQPDAGPPGRVFSATQDLADYLCPEQDVRLSTAALLSARFPFVSPAGRLEAQCPPAEDEPRATVETPVTYVVDGGYFESSAASPVTELARALHPLVYEYNANHPDVCVVPFFVQIDNGYETPDAPSTYAEPIEVNVPQKAYGTARGGVLASARQAASLSFQEAFLPDATLVDTLGDPVASRFVHIFPEAHPGVQAPLGWSLSPAAVDDLREQLDRNTDAIKEVRRWFSGQYQCVPT